MNCTVCNQPIADTAVYCPSCGSRSGFGSGAIAHSRSPMFHSGVAAIALAGVFACLFIGGIVAAVIWNQAQRAEQARVAAERESARARVESDRARAARLESA